MTSLFLKLNSREADRRKKYSVAVNRDPVSQNIIRKYDGIIRIDVALFCGESGMKTMKVIYRLMSGKSVTKTILVPVFPVLKEVISHYNGWLSGKSAAYKKPWKSYTKIWKGEVQAGKKS